MDYIFPMTDTNAHIPIDNIECIKVALGWIDDGHQAALAIVTQTWGSAPRPVGSLLAINDQSDFIGSVSGGCIEGEVATEAFGLMRKTSFKNLDFAVSDEQASGAGLACGGKVSVHVFHISGAKLDTLKQLVQRAEEKTETALLIDLEDGGLSLFSPGAQGPAATQIEAMLSQGESAIIEMDAGPRLFARAFLPPLRLMIIGAVHIAQDLSVMARRAGFDVTLIDPRDTWATQARFPEQQIDRRMPGEALAELKPDQRTALVALCHDPKLDDPALVAALRARTFYIGALGGRKNHGKRLARLTEYGFDEQTLSRISGPIGLDIGATTPAEIAVSILAEMIQALRK